MGIGPLYARFSSSSLQSIAEISLLVALNCSSLHFPWKENVPNIVEILCVGGLCAKYCVGICIVFLYKIASYFLFLSFLEIKERSHIDRDGKLKSLVLFTLAFKPLDLVKGVPKLYEL